MRKQDAKPGQQGSEHEKKSIPGLESSRSKNDYQKDQDDQIPRPRAREQAFAYRCLFRLIQPSGLAIKSRKQPLEQIISHGLMKVACIMMQKNESLRLDAWIRYHSALFGSHFLYIFDNGSTDSAVIKRLREAALNGSKVCWKYNQSQHYLDKGVIISNLIKELDASNPHDFYIPLDCDEFAACEADGNTSLSAKAITATLAAHIKSPGILKIKHKYWHNPYRKDLYIRHLPKHKSFFAQDACESLDLGFHEGSAKRSKQQISTNIVYFEFHLLPYKEHRKKCRDKLLPSLDNFSTASLQSYSDQSAHCARELLKSEYDYVVELLRNEDFFAIPGLLVRFDDLGIDDRKLFAASHPLGRLGLRLRRDVRQAWNRVSPLQTISLTSVRRRLEVLRQRWWREQA